MIQRLTSAWKKHTPDPTSPTLFYINGLAGSKAVGLGGTAGGASPVGGRPVLARTFAAEGKIHGEWVFQRPIQIGSLLRLELVGSLGSLDRVVADRLEGGFHGLLYLQPTTFFPVVAPVEVVVVSHMTRLVLPTGTKEAHGSCVSFKRLWDVGSGVCFFWGIVSCWISSITTTSWATWPGWCYQPGLKKHTYPIYSRPPQTGYSLTQNIPASLGEASLGNQRQDVSDDLRPFQTVADHQRCLAGRL